METGQPFEDGDDLVRLQRNIPFVTEAAQHKQVLDLYKMEATVAVVAISFISFMLIQCELCLDEETLHEHSRQSQNPAL